MKLPWKAEKRNVDYSDAVTAAIAAAALGDGAVLTGRTSAEEVAAGWYARAFASATITPAGPLADALTPEVLASIGRALCEQGEGVYVMSAENGLTFTQASAWTITGGHTRASWRYTVTINGPTTTWTMNVPSSRILHVMFSRSTTQPWKGIGPLAGTTRQLGINMEVRLSEETGGNVGNVIAVDPAGVKTELQTDIRGLKGRTGLVPSMGKEWEGASAPAGEYTSRRLGAASARSAGKSTGERCAWSGGLCGCSNRHCWETPMAPF